VAQRCNADIHVKSKTVDNKIKIIANSVGPDPDFGRVSKVAETHTCAPFGSLHASGVSP